MRYDLGSIPIRKLDSLSLSPCNCIDNLHPISIFSETTFFVSDFSVDAIFWYQTCQLLSINENIIVVLIMLRKIYIKVPFLDNLY